MASISEDDRWQVARSDLQTAYRDQNIVLFLGAGVSMASKLPSWADLVYMMYAYAVNKQGDWQRMRPFLNYLQAIAEHLKQREAESLEITARKIRDIYSSRDDGHTEFVEDLRMLLYRGYFENFEGDANEGFDTDGLLHDNTTLAAVTQLCAKPDKGARAVVTYNYDSLLESTLAGISDREFTAVFNDDAASQDSLPIYHPHGYLPPHKQQGSTAGEIIFTEEQYHRVSMDPYHWSNLIQLSAMSHGVGLMIGLSLEDRNIRRLLDALAMSPLKIQIYALLPKPRFELPDDAQAEHIHQRAIDINEKKSKSSRLHINMHTGEKGPTYVQQIQDIVGELKDKTLGQQEQMLNRMGITPIWFDDFDEILPFCQKIASGG